MGEVTAGGPSRYPGPASFEVATAPAPVATAPGSGWQPQQRASLLSVTSCEAPCDPLSSQRPPFSVTWGLSSRYSGGSCPSSERPFRAWQSFRSPRSRPGSERGRRWSRSSLPARSRFSSGESGSSFRPRSPVRSGFAVGTAYRRRWNPATAVLIAHCHDRDPGRVDLPVGRGAVARAFGASPSPRWRSCGETLGPGSSWAAPVRSRRRATRRCNGSSITGG